MTGPTTWGLANALALAALAWVLRDWSRACPAVRRRALPALVGAIGVAVAMIAVFRWADVPTGWITPLQEGRTMRNVQQLYGRASHAGAGFFIVIDWLSGHDVTTLPAVVALNLTLWLVNVVLFFFIADFVLCAWWASLAFAVVYAINLNTLHTAFSETPAMLWATYFWLGCIAAAAIGDAARTTPVARWLALVCLTLLAGLSATLRVELLVLGAPAVAIGLASVAGLETPVRRLAAMVGRALRALMAGPLWLVVTVVALLLLIDRLPWPMQARWLVAGLQPLNPSFLNMPRGLGVFLPWGMTALFVLGLVYGARRWFSFCLLPVTALILFKVYASAAHGTFFETFRYLSFLTPVALFLALFGFRELADWAARWQWPPWWRRAAVLVVVLTFTVWNPPGAMKEMFGRGHQLPGSTPLPRAITAVSAPLLSWNQQTEIRYLLDLIDRYPGCVFIVRAMLADAAFDRHGGYRWAAVGRSVPTYREIADGGLDLTQAATALAPGASCVFFYRGLDCDLLESDGCQSETEGRTPREELRLADLPYSDIKEYGAHRAEIRLGIYPIIPP